MNKEILTIENFKKRNKKGKIKYFIVMPFLALFIAMAGKIAIDTIQTGDDKVILLFLIPFFAFPLGMMFFLVKNIKKQNKDNTNIDKGNFKIIEDKIYDKYMYVSHDSDGPDHYYYYVFTKIYGKISTGSFTYDNARKNDSIYLLFYNNSEQNNSYENIKEEEKRNQKNIDQIYLATRYELSPELTYNFIPYNESLGENNFNNRIKDMIKEKEEKKGKVICKNCGKKYNLKKEDMCPECSSIYHFDIKDVMHRITWY